MYKKKCSQNWNNHEQNKSNLLEIKKNLENYKSFSQNNNRQFELMQVNMWIRLGCMTHFPVEF